jgi:hypothetical protein
MRFAQLGGVDVITRGEVLDAAMQARDLLVAEGFPEAIAEKDRAPWGQNPPSSMAWLEAPYASRSLIPDANQLVAQARHAKLDRIVLLGGGEAALAAKAIVDAKASVDAGAGASGISLTVADGLRTMSVSDGVVGFGTERFALRRMLVVVSGKSGATRETDGHRRVLEQAYIDEGLSDEEIARHFLVITDPGSPLEQLAHRGGYPLVLCDPAIPEGFAALTAYALMPAALAGADIARLLQEAASIRPALSAVADNPGLLLGSVLGGCAARGEDAPGRDKVAFRYSEVFSSFYHWIEHVITASTGKQGRGVLPVDGGGWPLLEPCHDMHSIALDPAETAATEADTGVTGPLGAQFLVWQYAAVAAAWLIGVNPFARPDEGESEVNAGALLRAAGNGPLPVGEPSFTEGGVEAYINRPADDALLSAKTVRGVFDALVRAVPVTGYLSINSYLDRDTIGPALQPMLASRIFRPVTHGDGPRCLDATGQYHKGGPATGVFLVVTADAPDDAQVPGRQYTLGKLRMARALGDVQALRRRGRPVVWLHLSDPNMGAVQLRQAAEEPDSEAGLYDLHEDEID